MKTTSNRSNQKNSSQQTVILDTNIFSYIGDKDISVHVVLYLIDLVKRGFGFAYSDFTTYELLRGTTENKESAMLKLLSPYFRYYLSENVILTAARLDNIMKAEKIEVNSIDHGDKFIAATAILTGSLIMTSNGRDFPWPLFHEIENKPLTFRDKNMRTRCYMVSLIRPDFDLINLRFKNRPK
jgi:predicted nucleic acid-binding protein